MNATRALSSGDFSSKTFKSQCCKQMSKKGVI